MKQLKLTNRKVIIHMDKKCDRCDGIGLVTSEEFPDTGRECPTCGGSGTVEIATESQAVKRDDLALGD